jgi:hypothetical protein
MEHEADETAPLVRGLPHSNGGVPQVAGLNSAPGAAVLDADELALSRRGEFFMICFGSIGGLVVVVLYLLSITMVPTVVFAPWAVESFRVLDRYIFLGDIHFRSWERREGTWTLLVTFNCLFLSPLLLLLAAAGLAAMAAQTIVFFPFIVCICLCYPLSDEFEVWSELWYSYPQALNYAWTSLVIALFPFVSPWSVAGTGSASKQPPWLLAGKVGKPRRWKPNYGVMYGNYYQRVQWDAFAAAEAEAARAAVNSSVGDSRGRPSSSANGRGQQTERAVVSSYSRPLVPPGSHPSRSSRAPVTATATATATATVPAAALGAAAPGAALPTAVAGGPMVLLPNGVMVPYQAYLASLYTSSAALLAPTSAAAMTATGGAAAPPMIDGLDGTTTTALQAPAARSPPSAAPSIIAASHARSAVTVLPPGAALSFLATASSTGSLGPARSMVQEYLTNTSVGSSVQENDDEDDANEGVTTDEDEPTVPSVADPAPHLAIRPATAPLVPIARSRSFADTVSDADTATMTSADLESILTAPDPTEVDNHVPRPGGDAQEEEEEEDEEDEEEEEEEEEEEDEEEEDEEEEDDDDDDDDDEDEDEDDDDDA